ncbi:MAG: 50S ribosomal protein L3 [Patescibacteria group bacterium]|jgi:large subunit ribosomal protein L3
MSFILAKKIGMSQRFADNGDVVPVTLLEAGPCVVTQVKTQEKDGYTAIQLGFGKAKHMSKARTGHLKDLAPSQWLREFWVEDAKGLDRGTKVDASVFTPGDTVEVSGTSKGKGFQGVVRRHHFRGGPASHGHKDNLRAPGSIGATFPQHVMKGLRMAGRMGGEKTTVKHLKVVEVLADKNLLAISGAIPGSRGSLVLIRKTA